MLLFLAGLLVGFLAGRFVSSVVRALAELETRYYFP
jgi:hypothetical protein